MIKKLKRIFKTAGKAEAVEATDPAQLACASLLVQAALLDGDFDAKEEKTIAHLLSQRFGIGEEQAGSLVGLAREHADGSVEMYKVTRDLKDSLDHEERLALMEMLWQVVYADGELHDYEANLMRRIAGLIYVTDRESGEARKRALRADGVLE